MLPYVNPGQNQCLSAAPEPFPEGCPRLNRSPWSNKRPTRVKALINVTSDGLLNLARVEAKVGFEIDALLEPHPVFGLIQRLAKVEDSEMFEVFNMGIGFCYVVAPDDAAPTIAILERHGRQARRIGYAVADRTKSVYLPQYRLIGTGKRFRPE